jgi:hypothetical protein
MHTTNHGVGGSYAIDQGGDRVLIQRTREQHELERPAPEAPADQAVEARVPETVETQARTGNLKKQSPSPHQEE